ncbi:hypothetical protein HPB50_014740 [Hyalomma asiaticum]|uniref:Uncharacterized protein n=1 Tax=Hyalomma asiaticum TaxID=266040 RepID=A0ACB7S9X9_HYAAI|nr:hypothetical protein HPB50_014740 [Hyalomma asiaticum]
MQTIRNYYNIRTGCSPVFVDFSPTKVPPAARKLMAVMPEKDIYGRRIIALSVGDWISSELPYGEWQKALTICLEHLASDPVTQILGVVLLLDYNGFTIDKMLCVSVGLLKKCVQYVQDCMPMRLKAVHVLNQSHTFDVLMIVRPLIKSKLSERVRLHGDNFEKLHEEVPPSALPEKYGGRGPPLDFEAFWRRLDAEEEVFAENNQ